MTPGITMGGAVAKLIDVERTSWSKPHSLETNETYAEQQREIIDKFFKVVTWCHNHHHLAGLTNGIFLTSPDQIRLSDNLVDKVNILAYIGNLILTLT